MTEAAPAPEPSNRALIARIARTYLAPRWLKLGGAMICAAIGVALTSALTQLPGRALDKFQHQDPQAYIWIPLTIVGLAILRAFVQILQSRTVNRIGHGLVAEIQVSLFGKLIRADLSRLRANHTGGFVSSILYDAGVLREAATNGIVNYTQQILMVLAMVLLMAWTDIRLTLAVLLIGPLSFAIIRTAGRRTVKAAKGVMSETSALSTAIMEGLDGVRIVKIENREAYEEGRVAAVVNRRQTHLIKGSNARSTSPPVTEALMMFVIAGILAYVGWRASRGGMTVGSFTNFLFAMGMAGQGMRQLANLQTVVGEGLAAARRLFAAMDVEQEVRERPNAAKIADGVSTIRFEDVSFAYTPAATALDGVNIEVRRGETIALVGPSGGGKSTILNLLPRFYDVTGGRVTIDGTDIRDVTLASLRHQIGLVTQEPFLFDESVRANIAYARPGATDAEIEAAAKAAAAHDFISVLPDGYGAMVGEAGLRLSGGQRQRIAIARAFLKDAPILLLDEATSALDTESEALVQAALDRLMSGRTTIMIAHRLSTVRNADRIYVIEAGRVVETGDHDSLVRAGGLYARLAASQNLDLKPEAAE